MINAILLTIQELAGFRREIVYSNIHPVRGDKLLASTVAPQRLPTGFVKLDEILEGGLLRGSITEFAGPSNTGKTVVPIILRPS